jgi:hypothetical protein
MDERDYKAMNKELKQREMNKQEKQLVCEHLDKLSTTFKTGIKYRVSDIIDAVEQFKKDNNLLENVSGWYLSHNHEYWCVYYDFEKGIIYGIDLYNEWICAKNKWGVDADDYPATRQQVEERLFPFFEKMYPKGTKVKSMIFENSIHQFYGSKYSLKGEKLNEFWMGKNCIMKDGILAEIVEESEVDKLKAELRKISDKLKELGE